MIALFGLVFVVLAFARSIRVRSLLAAVATAVVGCGHVLSLWSSIEAWTASGNPVAVLGALVLGRTGLAHEPTHAPAAVALVGGHPLVANAAFVVLSSVSFACLEVRLKQLHPETEDAKRLAALTNALLAVALVDGLLFAIGLVARVLVGD